MEILIVMLTIANILLSTIMVKENTKLAKENADLIEKNICQAKMINDLIDKEDKSIVGERTIETENIT